MKILVLAEDLRINKTSAGIRRSTFLQALSNTENDITCLYGLSEFEKIDWVSNVTFLKVNYSPNVKRAYEYIPKIRGIHTYLYGYKRAFKNNINDWVIKTEELLAKNNFDLIILLSSGSSFLPHYAMLKIDTEIPWIANFHDPYPFSLYPKPYQKKSNIIYKLQEKWMQKIISKATYVSFPSLYLKDWMQQFFPELEKKSIILPHIGIELDNLPKSRIDDNVFLSKGKFNLLHAGTLLGPRKVDSLFNAFQKFIASSKEKKEKSVLTILGKIAREHQEFFRKDFPDNLNIVLDRVSYKKSLNLLKQADLSLIIEAEGADFSPFMPGKLADLIMLEKPILVLSPKNSETNRILGEDYPYTTEVGNPNEIVSCLNKAWDDWKRGTLVLKEAKNLKEYVGERKMNNSLQQLNLN